MLKEVAEVEAVISKVANDVDREPPLLSGSVCAYQTSVLGLNPKHSTYVLLFQFLQKKKTVKAIK